MGGDRALGPLKSASHQETPQNDENWWQMAQFSAALEAWAPSPWGPGPQAPAGPGQALGPKLLGAQAPSPVTLACSTDCLSLRDL